MAKKLFFTGSDIDEIIRNMQTQLNKKRDDLKTRRFRTENDLKVNISYDFDDREMSDKRAKIIFSAKAWIKMRALVDGFDTEIEWHGLVERVSDATFFVSDIIVFSHEATATAVTSDAEEYGAWLTGDNEEEFSPPRLHGHSHVNMGVTPSAVDMNYRKNMLNNFGNPTPDSDYFYIFLILNKKGAISGQVYDLQNNLLYTDGEITIDVVCDNSLVSDFVTEAKKMVTTPRPKPDIPESEISSYHYGDSVYDSKFIYGEFGFPYDN